MEKSGMAAEVGNVQTEAQASAKEKRSKTIEKINLWITFIGTLLFRLRKIVMAAPVVYFALPNSSALRLVKPKWNGRALLKACTNGSSEMVTNLSLSLVNMLYNLQLISFAGENGVAAYGVIMYA